MTPFQWEGQVAPEEYQRRVELLRGAMRSKAITYNWHSPETSLVEAVLARGDRRIGAVLEHVVKNGGHLDAWDEYFSYERWMNAFEACGLDPAFYAQRERPYGEVFPWNAVSAGVKEEYLRKERNAAYRDEVTPDCRTKCTGCGAVSLLSGGVCDA
jgi:hypothetical protein